VEGTAALGRVPPLGSADVSVRSGMPTAESRRSPFGQIRSNSASLLCAHHGHPAEPGERSEPDIQASAPGDEDGWIAAVRRATNKLPVFPLPGLSAGESLGDEQCRKLLKLTFAETAV
jgi:hypothetical protein